MSRVFYLHLPADFASAEEDELDWLDVASRAEGRDRLQDLAGQASGCRVVVLVPARDVVLLDAELSTRNRQQLLKALPYVVEEQLGAEIESLHFATAPKIGKDRATVAVVAKERMRQWQEALYQAGIEPQAMIPESLALPLQGGDWSLLVDGADATLRTGVVAASCLPAGKVDLLLRLSLEQAGDARPERLRYFNVTADAACEKLVRGLCLEADVELILDPPASLLQLYASGLNEDSAINLMQGEFARKDLLQRFWRPWRAAAALSLALVILQSTAMTLDYMTLRRQDDDLRRQIEQLYRDAFPETRNLVDPRLQMEQQLKALKRDSSEDEFMRLLAACGPVLRRTPGLELDAMSYRIPNLDVDFRIKDFQSLDDLKAELLKLDGIKVTVSAVNAEQGSVRGQLRIQPGGS
ncbi:MAG: type II secretion system protein GspL [Chromatiaceae bacterium]|nr:type II secretion system protein GspL [Chromatiaceae bacterium]